MVDTQLQPPRRIVVGIDGSEHANRALAWALAEARAHGAALDVVSAWTLPAEWAQGYNPEWVVDLEAMGRRTADEAREAVASVYGSDELPDWITVTAVEGPAATILLERAEDADLIVVGTRGRGGISRLLLGSVSNAVIHHAPCPAVVVPAEDRG